MARALLIALLGGALIGAGIVFGIVPLLVPGVALVVLAIAALAWVLLAGRGRVERRLGATRVVEDQTLPVAVESATAIPLPGSELVEPLASGARRAVGWGRRHRLDAQLSFSRRGRRRLEPARLVVRDPLRIAGRELRASGEQEVLVLPRIEPVRVAARGGTRAAALAKTSVQPIDDGPRIELDTLREADPGVPASRIHWPAVARTGTLIERTLLPETDRRPLVILDASSPSSDAALDMAVRAAASLAVALGRAGGCDLLLPAERRPWHVDSMLSAWPTLHARLALVQEGPPAVLPARFARAGAIFWVVAGEAGPLGVPVPPALARAAGTGRFLVAPGEPAVGLAAFSVAGCHGRRIDRPRRRVAA